jgi:hypothetical protein
MFALICSELNRERSMDITTEAVKMQKALGELDLLISAASGEQAEELVRLRSFFTSALNQILDGSSDGQIYPI